MPFPALVLTVGPWAWWRACPRSGQAPRVATIHWSVRGAALRSQTMICVEYERNLPAAPVRRN